MTTGEELLKSIADAEKRTSRRQSFYNVMNQSISKLAKFYSHAVLSREQQMRITGGLAIICTFNVGGSFSYDGPCGAANVYLCTQAAGAQASTLSQITGLRVDFSCSGGATEV